MRASRLAMGDAKPDHARCMKIATITALKRAAAGSSLNIPIKVLAITSLVIASYVQ